MDNLDFSSFLNERLGEKGLTLKKLSESSGIALDQLQKLSDGNYKNLPPTPYLRGYVSRVGKILDFDPEIWWQYFEEMEEARHSGPQDKLPGNRFAVKPLSKYIFVAAIAALALIYLGIRFSAILGKPGLNVSYPESEMTTVHEDTVTVTGNTKGDQVLINSESVTVSSDGNWQKAVKLDSGLNTVEIIAKKFLGGETKIIKRVVYEPINASSSAPDSGTEP